MDGKSKLALLASICCLVVAAGTAWAGVLYGDPAGGWWYQYDGGTLDANWSHNNGSDEWDGTGVGSGRPGGVSALTDGSTTFLRIQDTGDPRDHGMADPGSNRKIAFTRAMPTNTPSTVLDDGVTLSFRARLSDTPPLDDVHPDGGGATSPWPAGGEGYQIHDAGKGAFSFRQGNGDQIISFALARASEHSAFTQDGLTFNSLSGTLPSANVDTGEGTTQMLPVSNVNQFHEFWVTIKEDTSGGGTHRVNVYRDGSTTPTAYHVTAGDGDDASGNYLAIAQGSTGQSGAVDIDFVAVRPGVYAPGAAAAPRPALVAYYSFDGNTNDQSGNGLHGTAVGDATYHANVPSQIGSGQSMIFDGSGDYVDLGNPGELNFDTNDWTVSGWIKTAQTASNDRGTLLSNGGDGGGGVRYTLTHNEGNNGTLRLVVDDNSTKVEPQTTSLTNDDTWHHIVGIRQGRAVAVYVDGELQRSDDLPAGYDLTGTWQQHALIGAARQQSDSALIKQLLGQVDDVAVWSVLLPHAAIQGLANGTYTPLTAPLTKPLPAFLDPKTHLPMDFLTIDIGASGQRVEPGAQGLSTLSASLTAVTGDVITVALDNIDRNGTAVGTLDWRDRGNSTNDGAPLVLLGEDHIKNNLGIIRATLTGLPKGDDLVTSYHVDAENSQCEAIEILLTDATGTNVLQAFMADASFPGGNPGGSGEHFLTTNLVDAHSVSFLLRSDGFSPVQILFDGSLALDDEAPLSGLRLEKIKLIPEPATLSLLGLGLLALARRRRRR